jgi:Spy/CpxP family protein refolding chaperone
MKKILTVGSAILAVVLLSGFGWRGGHGGWGRDPERMKQFVTWRLDDKLEDLKATEAQKKSIHGIKDRLFEDGKQVMAGQQAAREEAFTQLSSERPDAAKLHALVDERFEAMRALAHKATDAALEAHKVLTPEQRKALADEYRERMEAR